MIANNKIQFSIGVKCIISEVTIRQGQNVASAEVDGLEVLSEMHGRRRSVGLAYEHRQIAYAVLVLCEYTEDA